MHARGMMTRTRNARMGAWEEHGAPGSAVSPSRTNRGTAPTPQAHAYTCCETPRTPSAHAPCRPPARSPRTHVRWGLLRAHAPPKTPHLDDLLAQLHAGLLHVPVHVEAAHAARQELNVV